MIDNIFLIFKKLIKINNFLLFIVFAYLLFNYNYVYASKSNYFDKGKILYDKKEYDKSKILFERDIVFNPKSEKSYLYLAKIFQEKKDDDLQEINLNSVLLLNPKNDEAMYMLTLLKIKQSDYEKAQDLINKFSIICKTFCSKKKEMVKKLEKLKP